MTLTSLSRLPLFETRSEPQLSSKVELWEALPVLPILKLRVHFSPLGVNGTFSFKSSLCPMTKHGRFLNKLTIKI